MSKPTILIFTLFYYPGYKAGGPIKSIHQITNSLSDKFEFKLITSDRDAGDTHAYKNVKLNEWITFESISIFYYKQSNNFLYLLKILNNTRYDAIYLNSLMNKKFTITILLLSYFGLLKYKPILLAPRGECSLGALSIKTFRKIIYISLFQIFGLFKNLKWQASSQFEKYDISQLIGFDSSELNIICVAPDISSQNALPINKIGRDIKKPLQICFLSRISKMKNLDFALQVLTQIDIPIVFNIYGPIEDEAYWNNCKNIIKNIPNSVDVIFHDRIDPAFVMEKLAQNDLFFLPTLGENFGHVIAESLLAGTPVLISDQTPWRNLKNHGVGWDLPLNDPDSFRKAIVESANKSSEDYINWRLIVQKYGYDLSNDPKIKNQNIDMFYNLLNK